jgi:MarR family transcriptional regulator, transcriptional regulator for hemolysin
MSNRIDEPGMPEQPGPPRQEPIGLYIQRVAKELNRAFEATLSEVGGNVPTWLILVSLKSGRPETQRQLADAVGIRGATLTHHLEGLERDGLVARERDPQNRRVQKVALTDAGEAAFERMRGAALAFDGQLRDGLSEKELETLRKLLGKLSP